jgi:hypothetical protein
MTQLSLFPDLKEEPYVAMTEEEAKKKTADLLETLLDQGFVNVKEEDVSDTHLKDLIHILRK